MKPPNQHTSPSRHARGDSVDVVVYECHVLIKLPDDDGPVLARVARLPEITGEGVTEREALRDVVTRFKALARECQKRDEEIPWSSQPDGPMLGELERWIPVHL